MYGTDLYLNNDYTAESYRNFGTTFAQPPVESGTIITTINGASGPNITFSGGTTGLNFAGAGNTITMSGTLVVANGGTGATTAAAARTNLGAAALGANADINTFSALTGSAGWAAWTGTGDKTSHDTTTATLTNVAEALKALIDVLLLSGVLKV